MVIFLKMLLFVDGDGHRDENCVFKKDLCTCTQVWFGSHLIKLLSGLLLIFSKEDNYSEVIDVAFTHLTTLLSSVLTDIS